MESNGIHVHQFTDTEVPEKCYLKKNMNLLTV